MTNTIRLFCIRVLILMGAGLLAPGCSQPSLEPPGSEYGVGTVEDFSLEPAVKAATYLESDLKAGKPIALNFGLMDAHFITLNGVRYMVDWDDLEDFKAVKRGEKLNFRSSGYIVRLEKYGKNFRVIRLNVL